MTTEEKAKRYDKAIERAKRLHSEPTGGTERIVCEQIFPELKESEDEKTRKQIVSFLKEFECDHYRNLDFSSWIAWLEKQSEQKPVWSVEDETTINNLVWALSNDHLKDREEFCEWLNALNDRMKKINYGNKN